MDYIISILPQMWLGTIETLKLFFITIVLSIPLGILLALARVSSLGSLRSAVGVYVWLLRGTPLMLQLLFVYYGLPFIPGIGIRMDDFQAAIFAFVLNYAAYFCEIFRVVPKQTTAASFGDMNIAIKIATWLASVNDIGPITILGIRIGTTIPIPHSTPANTS
jgi:His/Glu/Gln/Arg/opine family amino acid ABC transporter permease subunit